MIARTLKALVAASVVRSRGFWRSQSRRRAMAVLCYHRVSDAPDALGLSVSEWEFDRQMAVLAKSPYLQPVSSDHFAAIWSGARHAHSGRVPVLVTFDDGFRDNVTVAAPILARHGVPAILFVATDVLKTQPLWYDVIAHAAQRGRLAEVSQTLERSVRGIAATDAPTDLRGWVTAIKAMDGEQFQEVLRVLSAFVADERRAFDGHYASADELRAWVNAGFDIGAHTCSHPRLSALTDSEAILEIDQSKHALEAIVGKAVSQFAYPFGEAGDFTTGHGQLLATLGFSMAYTTIQGSNHAGDNPFGIRRKCVESGLFACPGTRFSESLFLADLMGLGAQAKEATRRILGRGSVERGGSMHD